MKGQSGYATGDPRSIVTPEAFEIAPGLLGRPIASPWRRLGAILVDVALIGLLTREGAAPEPGRTAMAGSDTTGPGEGSPDPEEEPTMAAGSQPDEGPTVDSLTLPSAIRRYVTLYQEGPRSRTRPSSPPCAAASPARWPAIPWNTRRARLEREAAERSLERTRQQLEDVREGWLLGQRSAASSTTWAWPSDGEPST